MSSGDVIQTLASASTAIGVGIAAYQLWVGRTQRCAEFEQRLDARFGEIRSRIELRYLLDDAPFDPDDDQLRRAMYDYFVLCELEIFYVGAKRVTKRTWIKEWQPGIEANLKRPAFDGAWLELSRSSPGQFELVKKLIDDLTKANHA